MKKQRIFEFYGINKPLFVMSELSSDNIGRFVNRTELLEYFIISIHMMANCAIFGNPGTGKSSFLLKLRDKMKDSIYGDYLQFNFPLNEAEKSRLHFLRKILRSLLYIIAKNNDLLKLFDRDEIYFEIDRLEYSIIIEDYVKTQKTSEGQIEGGIKSTLFNLLIPAEFRAKLSAKQQKEKGKSEKKGCPIHDENTLYNTIIELLEKIDEPIVLFIDELDKVGRYPLESPEWDKEVTKILELSREIMHSHKIILVFALQNELFEKLGRAQINKEETSVLGLINSFKKLSGFDLEFAREAVNASLEHAGYKGGIEDLFENGVIEMVLSRVDGNPRLFMHYLIELVKSAFMASQHLITRDLLKEFLFEIDKEMNETRWKKLERPFTLPAPHK